VICNSDQVDYKIQFVLIPEWRVNYDRSKLTAERAEKDLSDSSPSADDPVVEFDSSVMIIDDNGKDCIQNFIRNRRVVAIVGQRVIVGGSFGGNCIGSGR